MKNNQCTCGKAQSYDNCCGQYISGKSIPITPEGLMRSRYTAYTQADTDYIVNTMYGNALKDYDKEESKLWAQSITWQRLEVVATSIENANKGFVEYKAYFIDNDEVFIQHEKSEFHKIDGRWFYVDGVLFN